MNQAKDIMLAQCIVIHKLEALYCSPCHVLMGAWLPRWPYYQLPPHALSNAWGGTWPYYQLPPHALSNAWGGTWHSTIIS